MATAGLQIDIVKNDKGDTEGALVTLIHPDPTKEKLILECKGDFIKALIDKFLK